MSLDIYLVDGTCSHCGRGGGPLASKNITHNVTPMWHHVGVYSALYMSDGLTAAQTLPALLAGIEHMANAIDECRAMNPPNGWGNADGALRWLKEWAASCAEYPSATIRVSK